MNQTEANMNPKSNHKDSRPPQEGLLSRSEGILTMNEKYKP